MAAHLQHPQKAHTRHSVVTLDVASSQCSLLNAYDLSVKVYKCADSAGKYNSKVSKIFTVKIKTANFDPEFPSIIQTNIFNGAER